MRAATAWRTCCLKVLLLPHTFSRISRLFFFLYVPSVTVDFCGFPSLCSPPHSLPDPSPPPPSRRRSPCTMNMRVKMRFCSKFPVRLARQPLGSLPTFCKSSPANQNSCRQSPDPEFPDKEMFMLSFFLSDLFYGESGGWKKPQAPRWIMRVAAGAYGYVRCIVCLLTRACMFD